MKYLNYLPVVMKYKDHLADGVDVGHLRDRAAGLDRPGARLRHVPDGGVVRAQRPRAHVEDVRDEVVPQLALDRKSTRLNSSHT